MALAPDYQFFLTMIPRFFSLWLPDFSHYGSFLILFSSCAYPIVLLVDFLVFFMPHYVARLEYPKGSQGSYDPWVRNADLEGLCLIWIYFFYRFILDNYIEQFFLSYRPTLLTSCPLLFCHHQYDSMKSVFYSHILDIAVSLNC